MPRDDDRAPPIPMRVPQLVAIVDGVLPQLVVRVVRALTKRFPQGVHGVRVDDYADAVRSFAVRLGDRYGIVDPKDGLRVLGLAVERGWRFDEGADGAWARAILGDARVTSATRRVDRLLTEAQTRKAIETRNRAIDSMLAGRARAR